MLGLILAKFRHEKIAANLNEIKKNSALNCEETLQKKQKRYALTKTAADCNMGFQLSK